MTHAEGRAKVQRAALLSILAALLLTLMKLVVGILSNSLGILSEAAHSGLDMAAAGITYVAVKGASKEPDSDHQYGHGKVENFAALAETIILWFTSIWIIYEALRRITLQEFPEPYLAGIIIMGFSVFIDWERSRMLYRTAEEHGSQALEADALHFSTDMISSAVVLLGVCFVWIGLPIADPIAAIGVAIVIFIVSLNLGKRTFDFLIDRAPEGLREKIDDLCLNVPGVRDCHRVRVRMSGPELFVDVVVSLDENVPLAEAHHIADIIEKRLESLASRVDVIVHMEPVTRDELHQYEDVYQVIQRLSRADDEILNVHNIRVHDLADGIIVAADLELMEGISLEEGHEISTDFENKVRAEFKSIKHITLHLETKNIEDRVVDSTEERNDICRMVKGIIEDNKLAQDCHNIIVNEGDHGFTISVDCRINGSLSIEESHEVAVLIEKKVKKEIEDVDSVFVHLEPL